MYVNVDRKARCGENFKESFANLQTKRREK